MTPYLIFILVLIIGTYIAKTSSSFKNQDKSVLLFAWFVTTFFAGSVDALHFGSDISAYFHHAMRANGSSLESYMYYNPFEPGYCVFLWSIVNLFHDPQAFMYVEYGFVTGVVFWFIYKFADNKFYGIIGYICIGGFTFYLTAMRQAMAMAICMIAFIQMVDGHKFRAILINVLAISFHVTSVVFLPVLFFNRVRFNRKNITLMVLGSVILSIFMQPLVDIGNEFMGEEYGVNGYEFKSYTGAIINILTLIATLWLLVKNMDHGIVKKMDNLFFYITLIALTLYLMRFRVLAMERVSFYFSPIASIALANGVERIRYWLNDSVIPQLYALLSPILFLVRCGNTFGDSYKWIF